MMPDEDCACLDIPRAPDFLTANFSISPLPVGGGLNLTVDRYLNAYWGWHTTVGAPIAMGASAAFGWLPNTCTPTPAALDKFLTGPGGSVTGFYVVGGGGQVSHGNDGFAPLLGVGTPGVSETYGKSYQLWRPFD